jgi:hypothetical protein
VGSGCKGLRAIRSAVFPVDLLYAWVRGTVWAQAPIIVSAANERHKARKAPNKHKERSDGLPN